MDQRYRDIAILYVLSLTGLSEQQKPKAALIVRGRKQLGYGFSKGTGTDYDTSPIFEALLESSTCLILNVRDDSLAIICTYFPSLEEFIALYSSSIRKVYYMGDITDEKTVRFLNNCSKSFEVIKLEKS